MNMWLKYLALFLMVLCFSYIYWQTSHKQNLKPTGIRITDPLQITLEMPKESGIFFIETTDRMFPPALVACSVESAARTYPNKTVYFLMKGLTNEISININSNYTAVLLLASVKNVKILPLSFEELFKDTPLSPWYQKIDPSKQRFWIHHVSDACRAALVWKYGGIYMDTDVLSLKPVPVEDFLAAEHPQYCSSAVLGFRRHHPFLWDCMVDYVTNYNGDMWGQQGPMLYTRMSAKLCKMPDFANVGDAICQNFSFLQPKRFYPISFSSWRRYYEKWENAESVFNLSYGLHFWNNMNKEHREVTAGSNTVAEHLFKDNCPLTYYSLVKRNPS
ncbi:alpha-1,4-N-acetylglucosaminyltransferase-like [Ambystoma mexicanum]|uniref:alpha-1,4-N-acetylglucosaminyltransferase-like n=1 Tax=Ambystoma mexicanum TaxID=8296 RepID=UPI0037E80F24